MFNRRSSPRTTQFRDDSIEFDYAYLENNDNLRGKRIFPLLFRWFGSNPLFVEKFSGFEINGLSRESFKKSWERGMLFNPSSVKNEDTRDEALFDIFGVYPNWFVPRKTIDFRDSLAISA